MLNRMRMAAGLLAVAVAVACAGQALAGEKVYKFKVASVLNESNPVHDGLMAFQKGVQERSGGRIQIDLFPNSQLGDTKDMLEQTRAGTNIISNMDSGQMDNISLPITVLGGPYIADTYEEFSKIVHSDLFAKWAADVEKKSDIVILCFNYWQGPRHFLTNKQIKVPADLNGLKIRTVGTPVYSETVRAMGAVATPLPWSDVYAAIQQKVVDGAEAQSVASYGSRLYECTKYMTKTGHMHLVSGLVIAKNMYDQLPDDLKKILVEEAEKSGLACAESAKQKIVAYEKEMQEKGMQIDEVDISVFRKATEPVYAKIGLAEVKKQVDAILGR